MQLFTWLSFWMTGRPQKRRAPARRPAPRFRPQLEALEDRWLPSALTLTVNSLGDSGTGSGTTGDLRYCINLANQNNNTSSTPDVIDATGLAGTDTLQQGELLITDPNLVIKGPGPNNLAISGGNQSRVFEVAAGAKVQLSGMTIEYGNEVPSSTLWSTSGVGGGILNWGTLTLNGDTLFSNSASYGGGIYNDGTMTLSSSTVTQNVAESEGSGIYNDSGGTLTLLDKSVVRGNYGDDVYDLGTLKVKGGSRIGSLVY
jgi:hypothetical protein